MSKWKINNEEKLNRKRINYDKHEIVKETVTKSLNALRRQKRYDRENKGNGG